MSTQSRVVIEHGQLRAIYNDRLLPYLEQLGVGDNTQISRASHVEPDPVHTSGGNWAVDLTPISGPGPVYVDEHGKPFVTHSEALEFEHRWIEANWLRKPHASA